MSDSNLRPVPSHRGAAIQVSLMHMFGMGLRQPCRATKYVLRKILWRIFNISDKIPVQSFLGQTPIYVIDVGAAGGIHARWERFGSNLRVFLFEPEKDAYDQLVSAFGSDRRMKVFDCALSEDGNDVTVHLTRWPRATSVYPTSREYVEMSCIRDHYDVVKTVKLRSKRLADVYDESDLDFLKIDTEGYELPILRGGVSLLDSCVGLELEVYFHQVRIGQPLFAEVDSYCRGKGFTFMDFEDVNRNDSAHFLLPSRRLESRGFTSTAEAAVYLRWPQHVIDLIADGTWSCEKLYKAVAIYLSYDQAEFAYVVLDLARAKGIVEPTDSAFLAAMKAIECCSGFNRSYIYYRLRRLG